ncbi:hypothetical protein [Psychrobacter alimentarius]|uniref:hypothetical protein n=1 Tax=Psychrobacter alimentarius TaxID=261164 RepID=UPI00191B2552|nr:hypothetical protein [Psychrobacter alimentarius]
MIEIPGNIILVICLLRCLHYFFQSHIRRAQTFWLAGVLIFITAIRRELNYLPDLFVPSDFTLLSRSYDWWEDMVLTVIYLTIVGLLIHSWRYLWALLKKAPLSLYGSVAVLAVVQYMGENAIVFPNTVGGLVEEISETILYVVVLIYLWRLNVSDDTSQQKDASELHYQTSTR